MILNRCIYRSFGNHYLKNLNESLFWRQSKECMICLTGSDHYVLKLSHVSSTMGAFQLRCGVISNRCSYLTYWPGFGMTITCITRWSRGRCVEAGRKSIALPFWLAHLLCNMRVHSYVTSGSIRYSIRMDPDGNVVLYIGHGIGWDLIEDVPIKKLLPVSTPI